MASAVHFVLVGLLLCLALTSSANGGKGSSAAAECGQPEQDRYSECLSSLDNLTRQLDAYHFTNPLSPAEDPRSLQQTCSAYAYYSQCMLSVRHCHQLDPTYLFMKASVGLICDPTYNSSLQNRETTRCLALLDRSDGPGNREIQHCLSNFSDVYDISINEITTKPAGSTDMMNAFCHTVFAVMNFAACAEPILYRHCRFGNSTGSAALTHALADYALKLGTDDGCITGEGGGGLADLRLPDSADTSPQPSFVSTNTSAGTNTAAPSTPLPPVEASSFATPPKEAQPRLPAAASTLQSLLPSAFEQLQQASRLCTALESNILFTCFAPFSGGIVENLTTIDVDQLTRIKDEAIVVQACSSYLIYEQCVKAVWGNSVCRPAPAAAADGGRPTVDDSTTERHRFLFERVRPLCTVKHLLRESEQLCFHRLPLLPGAELCSARAHRNFQNFIEHSAPADFEFGTHPSTCKLSQSLVTLTLCLAHLANTTCPLADDGASENLIWSTLNAHYNVYSKAFERCSITVITGAAGNDSAEASPMPTAAAAMTDTSFLHVLLACVAMLFICFRLSFAQ